MSTETVKNDKPAPHISDIRTIMAEQLRALRNASPEALESELKRSKAVSELSQTMINSAKVEIDYLQATKQRHSPFLEVSSTATTSNLPTPAATPVLRNNADEIKPKVIRTNWVGIAQK
jgi:hypothetical protein